MVTRLVAGGLLAAALAGFRVSPVLALSLDDKGEMTLGMRAYTAVRIGTEQEGGRDNPLSFPVSPAGHLRQHRYFLDLKFEHTLTRLARTSRGPGRLFGWLDPRLVKYTLVYRGEGEGIYDYGPREWSDQFAVTKATHLDLPKFPPVLSPVVPDAYARRRVDHVRDTARQRHRLFLAYLDFEKGPVFLRIGRQILAWGEIDIFRLLDNINPLDDSFGGFFIPLDERRVPLDMLRGSWSFGSAGPVSDAFLEGFAAFGNKTTRNPGTPAGSPWMPGGLGFPVPYLREVNKIPDRGDVRAGARLVFNAADTTFTLAHYYTYLDIPAVRTVVPAPLNGLPGSTFVNPLTAEVRFPRVQISGGSVTTALPRYYSVVRSEAAFFRGEPLNRLGRGADLDGLAKPGSAGYDRLVRAGNVEGGTDPFVYPRFLDFSRKGPVEGRVLRRDSFNFALGLDVNRYLRWLNPAQTFLFSTQFFYHHVFDSPGDLVLPVYYRFIPASRGIPLVGTPGCDGGARPCNVRPRLFHLDDDRFLHTLLVTTQYYAGRVVPQLAVYYDWQGALLTQPGVTLVRDPFRWVFDYTRIDGAPTGQIGALRDRDNVRFQMEYTF